MSMAIEEVMNLAAQEAVSARHAEITPAHLLIALSRMADGQHQDGGVLRESAEVRREFAEFGIDPKRFRRRLRGLVGDGGVAHPGGAMHRSPACRTVFLVAQQVALAQGEPVSMLHLLRAVLFCLSLDTVTDDESSEPGADAAPSDAIPEFL